MTGFYRILAGVYCLAVVAGVFAVGWPKRAELPDQWKKTDSTYVDFGPLQTATDRNSFLKNDSENQNPAQQKLDTGKSASGRKKTVAEYLLKYQHRRLRGGPSSLAAGEGILIVGYDGLTIGADRKGGFLWAFEYQPATEEITSRISYTGDSVFISVPNGKIYCLNGKTGALRWAYKISDKLLSSPAVIGNSLFQLVQSGSSKAVVALKADSGERLWTSPLPGMAGAKRLHVFGGASAAVIWSPTKTLKLDSKSGRFMSAHETVDSGAEAIGFLERSDLILMRTQKNAFYTLDIETGKTSKETVSVNGFGEGSQHWALTNSHQVWTAHKDGRFVLTDILNGKLERVVNVSENPFNFAVFNKFLVDGEEFIFPLASRPGWVTVQ